MSGFPQPLDPSLVRDRMPGYHASVPADVTINPEAISPSLVTHVFREHDRQVFGFRSPLARDLLVVRYMPSGSQSEIDRDLVQHPDAPVEGRIQFELGDIDSIDDLLAARKPLVEAIEREAVTASTLFAAIVDGLVKQGRLEKAVAVAKSAGSVVEDPNTSLGLPLDWWLRARIPEDGFDVMDAWNRIDPAPLDDAQIGAILRFAIASQEKAEFDSWVYSHARCEFEIMAEEHGWSGVEDYLVSIWGMDGYGQFDNTFTELFNAAIEIIVENGGEPERYWCHDAKGIRHMVFPPEGRDTVRH